MNAGTETETTVYKGYRNGTVIFQECNRANLECPCKEGAVRINIPISGTSLPPSVLWRVFPWVNLIRDQGTRECLVVIYLSPSSRAESKGKGTEGFWWQLEDLQSILDPGKRKGGKVWTS